MMTKEKMDSLVIQEVKKKSILEEDSIMEEKCGDLEL